MYNVYNACITKIKVVEKVVWTGEAPFNVELTVRDIIQDVLLR